jgi:hypothetical protein
MRSHLILALLLLAPACTTSTSTSEEHREVVLKYVGHDVGTVGPFTRPGTELDGLAEQDRQAAIGFLAHGAQGFLIIEPPPGGRKRVILVSNKGILGDFTVPKKS